MYNYVYTHTYTHVYYVTGPCYDVLCGALAPALLSTRATHCVAASTSYGVIDCCSVYGRRWWPRDADESWNPRQTSRVTRVVRRHCYRAGSDGLVFPEWFINTYVERVTRAENRSKNPKNVQRAVKSRVFRSSETPRDATNNINRTACTLEFINIISRPMYAYRTVRSRAGYVRLFENYLIKSNI